MKPIADLDYKFSKNSIQFLFLFFFIVLFSYNNSNANQCLDLFESVNITPNTIYDNKSYYPALSTLPNFKGVKAEKNPFDTGNSKGAHRVTERIDGIDRDATDLILLSDLSKESAAMLEEEAFRLMILKDIGYEVGIIFGKTIINEQLYLIQERQLFFLDAGGQCKLSSIADHINLDSAISLVNIWNAYVGNDVEIGLFRIGMARNGRFAVVNPRSMSFGVIEKSPVNYLKMSILFNHVLSVLKTRKNDEYQAAIIYMKKHLFIPDNSVARDSVKSFDEEKSFDNEVANSLSSGELSSY
ncbi:MAG: hypothetical protein ABIA04_12905 [Pseudomonadota bacterium]